MKSKFIFLLAVSAFLTGCQPAAFTADATATTPPVDTNAVPVNLAAEIARAKSENKMVLLEFGSSDSCPRCIIFQKDVFSSPEFLAYEKSNLIFLRLDFPQKTELPLDTKSTNMLLAQQLQAYGFPTFVVFDNTGQELWRIPKRKEFEFNGSQEMATPKGFINLLESIKNAKPK